MANYRDGQIITHASCQRWSHGIWIDQGRHILLGIEADPVTYGLGMAAPKDDQQQLALLTGANSVEKQLSLSFLLTPAYLPTWDCRYLQSRRVLGR